MLEALTGQVSELDEKIAELSGTVGMLQWLGAGEAAQGKDNQPWASVEVCVVATMVRVRQGPRLVSRSLYTLTQA